MSKVWQVVQSTHNPFLTCFIPSRSLSYKILLAVEFDLKALQTWEWQGMRQHIAQLGEALLLTVIDVVHFYFILLNILVYILSGVISTHYSDDVISLLIRMRADSACMAFWTACFLSCCSSCFWLVWFGSQIHHSKILNQGMSDLES